LVVFQDALDRNNEIQAKKRRDYDERIESASKREQEKAVEMLEEIKKQADDRKKKEDNRLKVSTTLCKKRYLHPHLLTSSCMMYYHPWQRLYDAADHLKHHIQDVVDRAENRSHFYAVVRRVDDYLLSTLVIKTRVVSNTRDENHPGFCQEGEGNVATEAS